MKRPSAKQTRQPIPSEYKHKRPLEQQRSQQMERQQLQQIILQFLIEANREPVHIKTIAEKIGRTDATAMRFLSTNGDGLWISVKNSKWWMTTLREIPDRILNPSIPK